jgi:hypothetical protein
MKIATSYKLQATSYKIRKWVLEKFPEFAQKMI